MISILLKTGDYRGDHQTDVLVAVEPIPGETVEALIARVMGKRFYTDIEHEVIEVRVTPKSEGGTP